MKRRILFIFSIVSIGLFFSCQNDNPEDIAWEKVKELKNLKAYSEFVKEFPGGKHKAVALKAIDETYSKLINDTSKLLSSYDSYVEDFPKGSLLSQYEDKIYKYAILRGDSMLKVIYDARFPEGKYVKSDTDAGTASESSVYKDLLTGTINLDIFFKAYPESQFKDELDAILADSVKSNPSVSLYEQYKRFFPEGNSFTELGKMAEDIYYQEVLKKKSSRALQQFINEFPESSLLTEVTIDTKPSSVPVEVTDSIGRSMQSFSTPGKIQVVEGMKMIVNATMADFEPLHKEIEVEELNQNFVIELQYSKKYILFEKFETGKSVWARNGTDYSAVIENNKLKLSSSSSQIEILKKQKIDFKRDFTLKMKFEFVKDQGRENNYIGLLWGDKTKIQYFFVDINGKAKSGIRESRSMSSENPMGYAGWERSWLTAQTFKKSGSNEIIIQKSGKKVTYSLNGLTISAFTLMNTPKNKFIGIGFGEVEVLIDQITLKQ